jgi:hypothetical protein
VGADDEQAQGLVGHGWLLGRRGNFLEKQAADRVTSEADQRNLRGALP